MLTTLRREISEDLRANGFSGGGLSAFLQGYWTHAGCYLLIRYRVTSRLTRGPSAVRLLARLIDARTAARTGCFISPRAHLEAGVALPHATGIVVGLGTRVAAGVTIYQHVTLGVSGDRSAAYPQVEAGAILYAGATIVGGVRIGRSAVIGAHAVVLVSVPDGAVAVGIPARILPAHARRPAPSAAAASAGTGR